MKRNRYVDLRAPTKRVNHALADKHRGFAAPKGYETSRVDPQTDEDIAAYRQLIEIEKVIYGMSKSDLRPRLTFHHKADSIAAQLAVTMAAGHGLERAR